MMNEQSGASSSLQPGDGSWRQKIRAFLSPGNSLRSRMIHGAASLLAGDAYSKVLRLAGNLIMTRLLYPEAFGLMLIVNLVVTCLEMLSDVGVRSALIVRKDGIDDRYVDTCWTMLIVRGVILTLTASVAAYPISLFYGQELLFPLIIIASLSALIKGFASPYQMMEQKAVKMGKIVLWSSGSQTAAMVFTISWLLIHPTVWALAFHGVVGAVISTVWSFSMFGHRLPRLCWDRKIVSEIFKFGRWIFIATALTFFARQGDSVIVSKWVTVEQLGVFSIAIALAKLVDMVVMNLNWVLLFPTFAELRNQGSEQFRQKHAKIKLAIFALAVPFILVFSLFGRDIIALLYDARYHEAGWILEVISAGGIFFAASAGMAALPLSMGDSFRHMLLQGMLVVCLFASMIVGGVLGDFHGMVFGIALANLWSYPIIYLAARKYAIGDLKYDLMFVVLMIAIVTAGWTIRGWPSP